MAASTKIEISTELLRTLHRIHGQRADLISQLERGPRQMKAGQALVDQAKEKLAAEKERLKKSTMVADEKQLQLKSRELRIEELEAKLNSAASNREFSTLKEQIAADRQANSVLSDEILEALEEMDVLNESVAQAERALQEQTAQIEQRTVEIESTLAGLRVELQEVDSELARSEQEIPEVARVDYRRLVDSKGVDALAPVESDSCGCCYQTLTTNLIDHLRLSLLVRCPNCNAFLYIPEDLTVR